MVGMDDIGTEGTNGVAEVAAPSRHVSLQLAVVEIIESLDTSGVGGEAGEVKVQFGLDTARSIFEEDDIDIERVAVLRNLLVFRNDDQHFMSHAGEFLGDVQDIDAAARSLQRKVVGNQNSQKIMPLSCQTVQITGV